MKKPLEKFLTIGGVARLLNFRPETVLALVRKGAFPRLVEVEGRRMFLRREIEFYLKQNGMKSPMSRAERERMILPGDDRKTRRRRERNHTEGRIDDQFHSKI
jgi:hypothetical protein